MRTFLLSLPYFYLAYLVWRYVLEKSAYPDEIPSHLKWIHAFIICFVAFCAWSDLNRLLWLLRYPSQIIACLSSQSNLIGKPSVGVAVLIESLSVIPLLITCRQMAKRKKSALKWCFILWFLNSASGLYVFINRKGVSLGSLGLQITIIFFAWIFVMSLGFYLNRSVLRSLFETSVEQEAKKKVQNT